MVGPRAARTDCALAKQRRRWADALRGGPTSAVSLGWLKETNHEENQEAVAGQP